MDVHDNTDNRKKGNVFDLYSAKRRERGTGDGNGATESGYYAIAVSLTEGPKGNEEWFRLHGEIDGQYSSIEMVRYVDVMRVYCPVPELIAIMCEHAVYTLEGRNLDAITIHLQDRTLRALYLFDPSRFAEPVADEPVIFRMEREDITLDDSATT